MGTQAENYMRRNKARRDVAAFSKLVGQPSGPVLLPANANLFVRYTAPVAANTLALIVGARSLYAPPGGTGHVHPMGFWSVGLTATPQAGFELCIDRGLGNYKAIGPL